MSHAGQLLAESPQLAPDERRLTDISQQECQGGSAHHRQRAAPLAPRPARMSAVAAPRSRISTRVLRDHAVAARTAARSPPASDLDVHVDPNQLRQIVWNLCENAIKYAVGRPCRGSRCATAA